MVDEQFRDTEAFGLFIIDIMKPLGVELEDVGIGEGEEDGRMGDDDVLGAFAGHFGHAGEEGELSVGREGRFRLVHQEDAGAGKSGDEVQEALAVGLLVEGTVAEHRPIVLLIFDGLGGDIVEAFRPEEETMVLAPHSPADGDRLTEFRIVVVRREPVIQRTALRIEPIGDGNRFQQSGLPRAILPHEKGDGLPQLQSLQIADGLNLCHIRSRLYLVPVEINVIYVHDSEWKWHPGYTAPLGRA